MCHSENKYGDKQNKNHWNLQTVNTTWKIDATINLIKTVGPEKLYSHLENRCGKQRKTVGTCEIVLSLGKHK